mgnify:CR=1 FL=1|tara:strand:+ start:3061 stop:3624 length:564 start_codon:yes stop_codon:yes gene_type:complete
MSNQSGYSATIQDMWSPAAYLETRNPNDSKCGAESAALKFTNESGLRFVMAHHEGPITRLETEQTLQIDANNKGSNDATGIQFTAHNGSVHINSLQNSIGIKASKTITLEADSIIIKAKRKLVLGGTESNYCRHIQMEAMKIDIPPRFNGELGKALKRTWKMNVAMAPGVLVGALAEKLFNRSPGGI